MSSFGKKTSNPGWIPGDYWVECQRTGKVIRASDARREWTGLIVAKEEWEPRHPQDYLRTRADKMTPRGIINPETPGTELTLCLPTSVVGEAVVGCAIVGVGEAFYQVRIPAGTFTVP